MIDTQYQTCLDMIDKLDSILRLALNNITELYDHINMASTLSPDYKEILNEITSMVLTLQNDVRYDKLQKIDVLIYNLGVELGFAEVGK